MKTILTNLPTSWKMPQLRPPHTPVPPKPTWKTSERTETPAMTLQHPQSQSQSPHRTTRAPKGSQEAQSPSRRAPKLQ